MAKVISDEILKLKIVINGDEAQKRVLDLEQANKVLGVRLKDLTQQEKDLDKVRKGEEKTLGTTTKQIEKLNSKRKENELSLINETKSLRNQQSLYQVGSKEYEKFQTKIDKVKQKSEESLKAINEEISSLTQQQLVHQQAFDKTTDKYKTLRSEIEKTQQAINDNREKIDQEVKSMDIMSLTIDQLTRRAEGLKEAMKHMAPGEGLNATRDELDAINERIQELREGPEEGGGFFDSVNEYIGVIAAVVASFAGILIKMQEVVDLNNKLVDAQTAVAKTTGMTIDEVKELTAAYVDFDTRTNKIDLLKIAEVGGRLGVPKAEIKEFTREVDKAYVALGDSFSGGVEKVAEKIGKIKGLFKETKDLGIPEAINQIGSGLNELGADGAASEENMADFALRIGQLPEALKPSIAETLALGGAFEESGIDAERASSGYMNFIRTAAKETAAFAKVMGISQKEVEKLINEDPMEFFLKFSEGAKGLDPVKLSQILDGLKLNSNEVLAVIGSASDNTEKFRKSIELSNGAVKDATSLQQEFDKVNNNAAAIYDKLKRKWEEIYTSEKVAKVLAWLIDVIGKLLGVVKDETGGVTMFRESLMFLIKIMTVAVTAIFSYNAALALSELTLAKVKEKLLAYTIVEKTSNLLKQLSTTWQNLYNISLGYGALALGRLTGSTNLQAVAQERLNLVTAASPWGAVAALVMGVVTAYMLFKSSADEAAKSASKQSKEMMFQSEMAKRINDEEAKSSAELKSKVEPLVRVLKDKNSQLADRKKAYEELIKIAPEFKGTLDSEYLATKKLDQVYSSLIEKIKAAGKVRALQALLDEQYEKREKLAGKQEIFKETQDKNKKDKSMLNPDGSQKAGIQFVNDLVQKTDKDLQNIDNSIDSIAKKITEVKSEGVIKESTYQPLPEKVKKGKKTDAEKDAEKAENAYKRMRQKMLDNQESYDQKEVELEAQKQQALADKQKDGYEKEKAQIEAERDKRLSDLDKQKIKQSDFDDIDKIIAREKGDLQKRFIEIKNQWIRENKLLEDTKIAEKEKANFKIYALDEKYLKEDLKKQEENLQTVLKAITTEQNKAISDNNTLESQKKFLEGKGFSKETLALITNWEEGKSAIEKYYQKKSLEEQVIFLQDQIDIFNMFAEITPEFVTEDQIKTIEEYKNKIATLMAEITKLKKGDSEKISGKLSAFGKGSTDLFGLTQDQWLVLFSNTDSLKDKIDKVGAAITVAKNMFSAYSSFVQANEQKMLQKMEISSDKKKKKLQSQLDAGLITQDRYKKETMAIDAELDRKKAEIEYKQAKRQRMMQIAEIVSNTALAIMQAWVNPGYPMAIPLSVIIGALGAVQLGTVMSQPLPAAPGAEDGFYPVLRSQDNKLFNARRRASKTGIYDEPTMLVGEAGASMPELVVSGKTMQKIDPAIQRTYMNEIKRVEGFEEGLYPAQARSSGNDELLIQAIEIIKANTEIMIDLKENGVKGYFLKNARTGKDVHEMTEEYLTLTNKNKH
ncbi:phage tail tape measure protein [Chryseobacterium oncorhynchi]|uniref:Phage tail tape measure protein n=1 Tax=Chryseobacterium oncorhynchi TaxID=741074 RepID=A0A316X8E5_9FLAO|nr:phage tail tape measure protein [Chryseobacterium oncorhynchi]PWN67588.1 phage tail tape measure protein [Chryseobacterium oncorhynchi]